MISNHQDQSHNQKHHKRQNYFPLKQFDITLSLFAKTLRKEKKKKETTKTLTSESTNAILT